MLLHSIMWCAVFQLGFFQETESQRRDVITPGPSTLRGRSWNLAAKPLFEEAGGRLLGGPTVVVRSLRAALPGEERGSLPGRRDRALEHQLETA